MGYRLYVAKKYEVEYAFGSAFNYKCEEFHNLLSICGADYTGESWDAEFEVTKEDWEMVIEKLKNVSELEKEEREEIENSLGDLECSTEEVIEMLGYYLDNSDPSNNYLHLSFI